MRRGLLAAVAAGVAGMLFAGAGCGRSSQRSQVPPPEDGPPIPGAVRPTPFYVQGVRCPPTQPAAGANLADDAAVVGVLVAGKARAYLLKALSPTTSHVVNDLVGDKPVTVTYCNQSDCLRAYTADTPGVPLSMDLGGWTGKTMLLRIGHSFYRQDSGKPLAANTPELPCRPLTCVRTSWGEWKKAHPETDVFTGK